MQCWFPCGRRSYEERAHVEKKVVLEKVDVKEWFGEKGFFDDSPAWDITQNKLSINGMKNTIK
jgi:hypothetical protein